MKPYLRKTHHKKGLARVAQEVKSTCLASVRSWVQMPVPQREKKSHIQFWIKYQVDGLQYLTSGLTLKIFRFAERPANRMEQNKIYKYTCIQMCVRTRGSGLEVRTLHLPLCSGYFREVVSQTICPIRPQI
jgi:hypothetical protein